MKIEYFPKSLSEYNCMHTCPLCMNLLDIFEQYIYTRKFKDECVACTDFHSDGIYCFCDNNGYYQKCKVIYCNSCHQAVNQDNDLLNEDDKSVVYSYKELYTLAKQKNIKYRSLMSKKELYDAIS